MSITNPTLGEAFLIAGTVGLTGIVLGMAWEKRFDHIFGISLTVLSISLALLFGLIP